jgi:hypothetical protein
MGRRLLEPRRRESRPSAVWGNESPQQVFIIDAAKGQPVTDLAFPRISRAGSIRL